MSAFPLKYPTSLLPKPSVGAALALVDQAIRDGHIPRPLPATGLRSIRVRPSGELLTALYAASDAHDLSLAETASGLLYSLWLSDRPARPTRAEAPATAEAFLNGLRAGQKPLARGVINGLREEKIVLAEGSTGIGKSRILVRAALDWLSRKPRACIVIAAPSLNIVSQVANEWIADERTRPYQASLLIGRAQFVSPGRLVAALEDDGFNDIPSRGKIADWVEHGGPARSSHVAKACRSLGCPARWLYDDLADLAPSDSVSFLRLAERDPYGADAEEVYLAMRDHAADAQVIFTSHAVVALNAQLRQFGSGLLPSHNLLLLDEAHEFEDAACSALTSSLSIFGLRLRLKQILGNGAIPHGGKKLVTALLEALEKAFDSLAGLDAGVEYSLASSSTSQVAEAVRAAMLSLRPYLQALDDFGKVDAQTIRDAMRIVKAVLAANPTERVRVRFTAVRGYPLIDVGARSLRGVLPGLWSELQGAALLSGTMFVENASGLSSAFMQEGLHLPKDRVLSLKPVATSWSRDNVTLHVPKANSHGALVPPCYEVAEDLDLADEAFSTYHDALAKRINAICRSSAGGVLVLFTAYRDIFGVRDRLPATLQKHLLCQGPGDTVQMLKERFCSNPKKSLWLATGAAWSGLDLGDGGIDPGDDLRLTTLVIARLPFNKTDNPIMEARLQHRPTLRGVLVDFKVRQGMGRVVRHPEHIDRHVWILDPRVAMNASRWPRFTAHLRRTLARYPNRVDF